jgi:hypothetical protein
MKINSTPFMFLLVLVASTLFDHQVQSQAITGFQLVNTTSNSVIGNLVNGATISLPSGIWTIQAVAAASPATKSVAFNLDGNSTFRLENAAPWTMTGKILHHPLCSFVFQSAKSTVDRSLFFFALQTTILA